MILAIDAGNSNLCLAAFSVPARPLQSWRLPTHPIGSPAELIARLEGALAASGLSLADFEAVVLASVVPALTGCLREAIPGIHVIDSSWPFSFRIGTDQPQATGIDRLVNAEAALREAGAPAIIVDAGTATTVDALSERGFLGGAILPGMELLRDSLASRAAQLFAVDLHPPTRAIGRDTREALQSGLVLGYASMIDGMVRRFRSELEKDGESPPIVVSTGGLLWALHGVCEELPAPDPDLTVKGIFYLYESLRSR